MSDIGLLYVGAVLIINGVMLLGVMTGRDAAPLNLFVGAMQVFTPTLMVVGAQGDDAVILAASGLYLFGFTYLWVGINALAGLPARGSDGSRCSWRSRRSASRGPPGRRAAGSSS